MAVVLDYEFDVSVLVKAVRVRIRAREVGQGSLALPGLHIIVGDPKLERISFCGIWRVDQGDPVAIQLEETRLVGGIGNIGLIHFAPGLSAIL